MSKLPLEGGCYCGIIRYRAKTAPLMVYNCHCKNCQKMSGAAFSTNVTIPAGTLEIALGDPGVLHWGADSSAERFALYCESCKSRIAHGWKEGGPPILNIRAGTLDDTTWVKPVVDIWKASAQCWVQFPDDRPSLDRQPGDVNGFKPYFDAFRAQGNFSD
jgi:hypothetical protein